MKINCDRKVLCCPSTCPSSCLYLSITQVWIMLPAFGSLRGSLQSSEDGLTNWTKIQLSSHKLGEFSASYFKKKIIIRDMKLTVFYCRATSTFDSLDDASCYQNRINVLQKMHMEECILLATDGSFTEHGFTLLITSKITISQLANISISRT